MPSPGSAKISPVLSAQLKEGDLYPEEQRLQEQKHWSHWKGEEFQDTNCRALNPKYRALLSTVSCENLLILLMKPLCSLLDSLGKTYLAQSLIHSMSSECLSTFLFIKGSL